jgi:hypothetical protein
LTTVININFWLSTWSSFQNLSNWWNLPRFHCDRLFLTKSGGFLGVTFLSWKNTIFCTRVESSATFSTPLWLEDRIPHAQSRGELQSTRKMEILVTGSAQRKSSTSPMWFRIDWIIDDFGLPNDLITDAEVDRYRLWALWSSSRKESTFHENRWIHF